MFIGKCRKAVKKCKYRGIQNILKLNKTMYIIINKVWNQNCIYTEYFT